MGLSLLNKYTYIFLVRATIKDTVKTRENICNYSIGIDT